MFIKRSFGTVTAAAAVGAVILTGLVPAASPAEAATTFAEEDLVDSVDAYLAEYSIGDGQYLQDPAQREAWSSEPEKYELHFWEASFVRQTLTDVSRLTGAYKAEVAHAYEVFEERQRDGRASDDWYRSMSDWKDDYSWAIQFALEAYEVTGDRHMLNQAKWHFDDLYRVYYDDEWGGGFWRETGKDQQKDIPTAGLAIGAANLARYFPDERVHNDARDAEQSYLEIAAETFDWINASFLRPDGGLENSFSKGGTFWDDNLYTYNAGIYLELASQLYERTRDPRFLADGRRVADYVYDHLTVGEQHILVHEDDVNGGGLYRPDPVTSAEIVFKGIFFRGLCRFITLGNQQQYIAWLADNAQASFDHRSSGIPAGVFDQTRPGTRATAPMTGIAAMTYTLALQKQSAEVLEGENGRHFGSAHNEGASAASNGRFVGSLDRPGNAIEFRGVRSADRLTLRTTSANASPRLSIYINGKDVADAVLPPTGNWNTSFLETTVPIAVPEGATLKVQFDDGDSAANIDWIRLSGASDGVRFFDDANFSGRSTTLAKGTYTVRELERAGIVNDTVSSLRVPLGWTVEIYDHGDLDGRRWDFSADVSNLGPEANDRMSSVRIR